MAMPDFIACGLNPLDIHKIIAMVGRMILLCHKTTYSDPFNPTFTSTTTAFAPRDLFACIAFSRTWRRTLLPILWRSYDDMLVR